MSQCQTAHQSVYRGGNCNNRVACFPSPSQFDLFGLTKDALQEYCSTDDNRLIHSVREALRRINRNFMQMAYSITCKGGESVLIMETLCVNNLNFVKDVLMIYQDLTKSFSWYHHPIVSVNRHLSSSPQQTQHFEHHTLISFLQHVSAISRWISQQQTEKYTEVDGSPSHVCPKICKLTIISYKKINNINTYTTVFKIDYNAIITELSIKQYVKEN